MTDYLSATEGAVEAIADLARDTVLAEPVQVTSSASVLLGRMQQGERFAAESLERYLADPLRARGHAVVTDPTDFVEYVQRLLNRSTTTLWADEQRGTVTAVFDDHADSDSPGWRSHTAVLQLADDADWLLWKKHDDQRSDQLTFAEFLENVAHTVVDPPAADLMMIATTLTAKRKVDFSSSVRTDNGDWSVSYDEQTTTTAGRKGSIDIPAEFTVRLSPWLGVAPTELTAKLRHRIEGTRLTIGFKLIRPDIAKRNAFAGVVSSIRKALNEDLSEHQQPVPVLLGTAPQAVEALR